MGVNQAGRKKNRKSGGRKRTLRKKRKYEKGNLPTNTIIAEKQVKKQKKKMGTKGGHKLKRVVMANVYNPGSKKYSNVKIISEVDNPANREFARRNILTKSAIIKTELGNARITSRPGQDAVINAVLIEAAKEKPAAAPKPKAAPKKTEEKPKEIEKKEEKNTEEKKK